MHLAQSFKTKLKQKKSKLVNENKSYPKWNENKRRAIGKLNVFYLLMSQEKMTKVVFI